MPLSVDQLFAPEQTSFRVYTAPADTALPTDIDDPFMAPWFDQGYIPEENVTITVGREKQAYRVMQSLLDIRTRSKSMTVEVGLGLSQWSTEGFEFIFGGGTFEALANGVRYKLPKVSPNKVALAIEVKDDLNVIRFGFFRGLVTGDTEIALGQESLAQFPVTYSPEPDDNGDLGDWDTNVPGVLVPAS